MFFFSLLSKQETEMQRDSGSWEVTPFRQWEVTPFRQYVSEEDDSYVSSPPRVAPVVEQATPSSHLVD